MVAAAGACVGVVVLLVVTLAPPPAVGGPALTASFTYSFKSAGCNSLGQLTNYVSLNASASGGTPPYRYFWQFPAGNSTSPQTETNLTYGQDTNVTLTVTDATGNSSAQTQQIPMELASCPPPSHNTHPRYLGPPPVSNDAIFAALIVVMAGVLAIAAFGIVVSAGKRRPPTD